MVPAFGLVVGLVGGAVFFAALRAETALLVGARSGSLAAALALHATRAAAVVGGLTLLAWLAPMALVPAVAGLTCSGLLAAQRAARGSSA